MKSYRRIKRDLVHKGNLIDFYNDTILIDEKKTTNYDFLIIRCFRYDSHRPEGMILMVRQHRNAIDGYSQKFLREEEDKRRR